MTKPSALHNQGPDTEAEPPAEEPALYADPFSGQGFCKLAQAVDPQFRAAVTQYCPRCGRARDEIATAEAPACILQGIDLDTLVLDDETIPRLLRPEPLRSKVKD